MLVEITSKRQINLPVHGINTMDVGPSDQLQLNQRRRIIMHNTTSPADVRDALREAQMSNADTTPSLALQFTALTASRLTPVRLARLTDIDMDSSIWRIPAHHNKSGFQQLVPLSRDALSVLERAERIERHDSDLVFPSRRGTALGANTLSNLCRKLNLHLRPHQFRTAFAVWCFCSCVPHELIDVALGHKLPGLQAFQSLFLERRAPLMQAWADFLAGDLADDWFLEVPCPEEDLLKLKEKLKETLKSLEENKLNSH